MKEKYSKIFLNYIVSALFLLMHFASTAQVSNVSSRFLNDKEIDSIFDTNLKSELGIHNNIFRTACFKDKMGENYLVFTARKYVNKNKKELQDTIQAYCIRKDGGKLQVAWQMKDFIVERNEANTPENSIWFLMKYMKLQDINNDGLMDPILVYCTSGKEGKANGRVKILIYYKDRKYAIRHQNDTWDFGVTRTEIDVGFYKLPRNMQTEVETIMDEMNKNNDAGFPREYKKFMNQKKLIFEDK